ncbi:MAG: thiamine diphosphokinase [Defluviitaleaceae bacterium]|nr:thiamine diphosphokinase [Defluviitaleaceae bacterium]
MRAVIISGGTIEDYNFIKKQINSGDTVICADSGYDHAVKMGIDPHIILGDFDSIGSAPKGVALQRHPSEKDLTDTEIAIEYARGEGFKDFLLLGVLGSRIDHSLTNILLLQHFLERGENAVIINENNKIMITNSALELSEPVGSIISLVPLTTCEGVTTKNLKYPLEGADMLAGKGLGVSNIMLSDNATVSLQKGLMLVIVAKD